MSDYNIEKVVYNNLKQARNHDVQDAAWGRWALSIPPHKYTEYLRRWPELDPQENKDAELRGKAWKRFIRDNEEAKKWKVQGSV